MGDMECESPNEMTLSVDVVTPPSMGTRKKACKFCGKTCSSSSALLYHTRLHTGERPYVCRFCQRGFIQKVHLLRHVENNHLNDNGKGRQRTLVSNPSVSAQQDSPTAIVSPGNRLEALASQLKSRAEIKQEVDKIRNVDECFGHDDTTSDPATSEQCSSMENGDADVPIATSTQSSILGRLSNCRAEPCPYCDQLLYGQIAYLEHIYEKHGITDDNDIGAVLPLHNDDSPDGDYGLEITPEPDVNIEASSFCERCAKQFPSPVALAAHMKAHESLKPYACTSCDKSFMHQNSLKVHMFSHTGIRPHKCHICDKAFTTARTLKIHTMIHTGERPYGCKFCGRRFIQQIHLLRHIKSHIRKGAPNGTTNTLPVITTTSDGDDTEDRRSQKRKQPNPVNESASSTVDTAFVTKIIAASPETAVNDATPSATSQERVDCMNCQIFEGELTLLKRELGQLKQFLNTKLTLMEQKVEAMRCAAAATPNNHSTT